MNEVDMRLNITRITIEAWRKMVADGFDQPVDVPTAGVSMWPLLRNSGDGIKIVVPNRPLKLGDIIMFATKSGKNTAHRICWMEGDRIQTLGDNCSQRDEIITGEQIFGLVTHIRRKDRYIAVDTRFWYLYGRLMTLTCPFRMFIRDRLYMPVKIWLWKRLKGNR